MKKILQRVGMALGFLLLPSLAVADSITPDMYMDTLAIGETVTITKTVTVDAGRPTTAKVDVFFLTDTTGSMGGTIAAVIADATAILASIGALGDVHFGVGEYKDFSDSYAYKLNTALTGSAAAAAAGIGTWGASGGGDFFEANLFALNEVATTTPWRAGSTRVLVWFGDAPGHDPSGGISEIVATAALLGEGIIVHAIDSASLDSTGQATRITDATGGTLTGIADPASDVADAIVAAIDATFATYGSVSLDPVGNLPGVDVTIVPGAHVGAFDRSMERTFEFDVTFEGLLPGEHHFVINALVDGGIVATEEDWITVSVIPLPAAFPLYAAGVLLLGFVARRKNR